MRRLSSISFPLLLTLVVPIMTQRSIQDPVQEARSRMEAKRQAFYKRSVSELVKDLEQDPSSLSVIQRLRMLDDPSAIDPLKRAFERVGGQLEKRVIAATLLSLGVREGPYFDLLSRDALEAVRFGMPFPLEVDGTERGLSGQFAPDFLVWCRERELDPSDTAHQGIYELPMAVQSLTYARDPRAASIFLEALEAPNLYIVAQGITGLAILRRKEAIQSIIQAVERFPPQLRPRQAAALLVFDEPIAQDFARRWIPDEQTRSAYLEFYRQITPGDPSQGQ